MTGITREMDIGDILIKRLDRIDDKLDRIEIQTTEHNHRMNKIEEWISSAKAQFKVIYAKISMNTKYREELGIISQSKHDSRDNRRWVLRYALDLLKWLSPLFLGFVGWIISKGVFS